MPKITIAQYVGGTDFLANFFDDIKVMSYDRHKIVLKHKALDATAIIKGHDFTFGFTGLTGGLFKSLKIFAQNDGNKGQKLLLEAHTTGKGVANVLDALEGKLGNVFDASGSRKQVKLTGSKKSDTLVGSKKNDVFDGDKGDDEVFGGKGNDKLKGGSGDDTLKGGGGDDKLTGGAHNDRLNGGDGKDIFVFSNKSGRDTVLDFKNNKDTIWLNDNLWNGNKSVRKLLKQFGDETKKGVTLDFGDGDVLKIKHVSDIMDLKDDILVF